MMSWLESWTMSLHLRPTQMPGGLSDPNSQGRGSLLPQVLILELLYLLLNSVTLYAYVMDSHPSIYQATAMLALLPDLLLVTLCNAVKAV